MLIMITRLSILLCILCCVSLYAETTFYVAKNGSDRWTGRLDQPNAAKTDGPFATLEAARDAVRILKTPSGIKGPVSVIVRKGTYTLDKTLVLTGEDSGTRDCPITYQAFPGEAVTLTGGRSVKDWRKHGDGIYAADLAAQGFTDFRYREIFFKGKRQILARYPNMDPAHPITGGFLYVDEAAPLDTISFYAKPGSIPLDKWGNITQAEAAIFPYHCWDYYMTRITKADARTGFMKLRYNSIPILPGNRFFVQNVLGALDASGEWYSDWQTGRLYFYSPAGTIPADGEVTVPVLENIVEFSGTPEAPITNISFSGFRLTCAKQDAITIEGARDCRITGNSITQVGGVGVNVGYLRNAMKGIGLPWKKPGLTSQRLHSGDRALFFSYECQRIRVVGNDIDSVGAEGIAIWGRRNVADNNHISRTGLYDRVCAGITVCGDGNLASHNTIHDAPRDGIFVNGKLNTIEYNDIRQVMLSTADDGAITLRQHDVDKGVNSKGNVIRYNLILDSIGYGTYPHGTHPGTGFTSPWCSFGIYLDAAICGVTVYGNIIARTGADCIYVQYGGDHIIENNIFVQSDKDRVQFNSMAALGTFMYTDFAGKYKDKMAPNQYKHNIFYYGGLNTNLYQVWHGDTNDWDRRHAQFDENLLWHKGKPISVFMDSKMNYKSLDKWQGQGYDVKSIVADPLFVNAARDDYRLQPNSPAYKVGFKDINAEIEKIGAYMSGERASWPLINAIYPKETPLVFDFPKEAASIIDGFERSLAGLLPAKGAVAASGSASVLVSDEAAKDGNNSLKFTYASNAANPWEPHIYYRPEIAAGKVHFSIDVMNSAKEPARFTMEFREWEDKLVSGPSFSVTNDGKVLMGGKLGKGGDEIVEIPNGVWCNVSMDFELGDKSPGTCTLKLSVPGKPDVVKTMPFPDAAFRKVTWFGISNTNSDAVRTVFYADNLILGLAADEKIINARSSPAIKGEPNPAKKVSLDNPDRLVGHWKFDENRLEIADSSGNGLNGEQMGALRATGSFGTALYLDGYGAPALIEDSPLLHFGTDDFAIEGWFCPTMLDIDSQYKLRRIMGKEGWPSSYWNLDILTDGALRMEMLDIGMKAGVATSAGKISENSWTHVVVMVDRKNSQVSFYYNGKLDSILALPSDFTGTLDVPGKALSFGTWQPYIGMLRDLRIYRRVLTDSEISAAYNSEKNQYTSAKFLLIPDD